MIMRCFSRGQDLKLGHGSLLTRMQLQQIHRTSLNCVPPTAGSHTAYGCAFDSKALHAGGLFYSDFLVALGHIALTLFDGWVPWPLCLRKS
jgi:hypothetical protein